MAYNRKPEVIDIAAEIRGETEKAWKLFDGTVEAWVPKSRTQNNGDGTFTLEYWIYEKSGFETVQQRRPTPKKPLENQPAPWDDDEGSQFTTGASTARQPTIPWYLHHQRINKITGEMALRGNKATIDDLRRWLSDLKLIIAEWERDFSR